MNPILFACFFIAPPGAALDPRDPSGAGHVPGGQRARVGAKNWAENSGDSMGRFFLLPAGRDNL